MDVVLDGPLSAISRHKDVTAIAVLLLLSLLTSVAFFSPYLYEWDSVQFALALDHFDVAAHQPHPPGYPVYVFFGKLFNLAIADKAIALNVMSGFFGALSIIFTYLLAREMFGRKVGFLSALLLGLAPAYVLFSVVAMTDVVSLCLIVAGVYLLYTGLKKNSHFLLGSLVMGLAIGVRPQHFFYIIVLLAIFLLWKKNVRMSAFSMLLFGAGILVWLVPLLALSGGPANYLKYLGLEMTGIVRLGFSPLQFKSLARRMLDGWTPVMAIFSAIVAASSLLFLKENRGRLRDKISANGPFILLAAWIISAIVSILTFENLYTVRYILPIFAPVSVIFAYCIEDIGKRIKAKKASVLYYSMIAISILAMAILSFSLVSGIQSTAPAPVQAAQYIGEHYGPDNTMILADLSYRHFQYYLPGYTVWYSSANYGQVMGAGKPLIVSDSPMTLDNSTPIALFQKPDILNYKHGSVGLYETGIMDHLFVDAGFFPVEQLDGVPIRWATNCTTIVYNASTDKNADIRFEAISYNETRTMQFYLNGEIVHEQRIPGGLGDVKTYSFADVAVPLTLKRGENIIIIRSVERPQRPCDLSILNAEDTRELSFALRNVTVIER